MLKSSCIFEVQIDSFMYTKRPFVLRMLLLMLMESVTFSPGAGLPMYHNTATDTALKLEPFYLILQKNTAFTGSLDFLVDSRRGCLVVLSVLVVVVVSELS